MGVLKTDLFDTVHPMTYLYVIKSIVWGVLIIIDAKSQTINLLTENDMLWPVPLTYVWAAALIVVGILTIIFFLRDHCNRDKNRIMVISTVNLMLWVFAGTFWFVHTGSQIMIVISAFNAMGSAYVALASKYSRPSHRV